MRVIQEGRVARVIIAYKDRLTQFGFPFLEAICRIYNVPILEVKVNSSATLEDQLVTDMMSFDCDLFGEVVPVWALKARGDSYERGNTNELIVNYGISNFEYIRIQLHDGNQNPLAPKCD